jgi:hypothetical protein
MCPEWTQSDWLAAQCVFEPVSDLARAEMGKIMGKTRKLPRAHGRNAENHCGTGISDDSDGEK